MTPVQLPRVAILIPTYNRYDSLLGAVRSAAAQDYANLEIIVCDNHSSATGYDLLESDLARIRSDIRVLRNPNNIGPINNWNRLLAETTAEYAIILCDDDYFTMPGTVRSLVDQAVAHSLILVIQNALFCYPGERYELSQCQSEHCVQGADFFRQFWRAYQIPSISVLFSVSAVRKLAGFDERFLYADILMWLKLACRGNVGFSSPPGVAYVFHGHNIVTSIQRDGLLQNMRFIEVAAEDAEAQGVLSGRLQRSRWERSMKRHYCQMNGLFGSELIKDIGLGFFLKLLVKNRIKSLFSRSKRMVMR